MNGGLDFYFASCSRDGGICHYTMMPDGMLGFREKVPLDRPMYLARQGDILVALLRAPFPGREESGLVRYAVAPDGTLKAVGGIVGTKGTVAAHLCFFHSTVYVANYLSGSLFREDGLLCTHTGHGSDPVRQLSPHPHMVNPSPDGIYLLATDLGLDMVCVYDQDFRLVSWAQAPKGSGPRHLVVLDAGHIAVVNEMGCSLSLYAYGAGSLQLEETIPLLPNLARGATAAAIRMNGSMVYVSVRGANRIVVLRWDGRHLHPVQDIACGGVSPRDIVIAEGSLWCMNELSSTVVRFLLSPDGSIGGKRGVPLTITHVLSAVTR